MHQLPQQQGLRRLLGVAPNVCSDVGDASTSTTTRITTCVAQEQSRNIDHGDASTSTTTRITTRADVIFNYAIASRSDASTSTTTRITTIYPYRCLIILVDVMHQLPQQQGLRLVGHIRLVKF